MPAEREDSDILNRAGVFIREHAHRIIEIWIDRVGVDPHASGDHRVHLRDHLPELLEKMGMDLIRRGGGQSDSTENTAEKHGRQRWQLGWGMKDVVHDYQSLRPVLNDELTEEFSDPLPTCISSAVTTMIDEAVADSLKSYAEYQTEQQDKSFRKASEFAAIVSSSADAIIGIAKDGTIRSWNRAAEELYGYSQDEAVGKPIQLIIPDERQAEIDQLLDSLSENNSTASLDTTRLTKAGKKLPVTVSMSPICDRTGAVVGAAAIERDVSEREMSAAALRRALDEAEAANRAKSEFLANVSHELRTPMNAVLGMTALTLDEDSLSEAVRDNLQTAHDAAHVMLGLVNDLLDVSRLESGRLENNSKPFSLRKLLDETIRVASVRAFQKGIDIECRVDRNVPDRLEGDSLRIRQILTNLVDNAVKFTSRGRVAVHIVLEDCAHDECQLRFRVEDTGVGISKADLERIFDPFTQVEATSTRRFGGTGLGLAIAKRLAAHLGGELKVESTPGVGSIFLFDISVRRPENSLTGEEFLVTAEQLQNIHVLIVDNGTSHQEMLVQLVERWGMKSIIAPDVDTAERQLRSAADEGSRIEVVLIEALLPDQDGFKFASRVANLTELSPATLLMISPSDRLTLRERCQESCVDGFVDKPIRESNLFDSIVEVLSLKTLKDSTSEQLSTLEHRPESLNILVVEDTLANRKVVTRILSKRGHNVSVALNGREAVDLVRKEDFDVVLMDVQMPIMDGFEATREIRRLEEERSSDRSLPIIAMTAHAMHGDREKCLSVGMDDYIAKPIDMDELADLVEKSTQLGKQYQPRSSKLSNQPKLEGNPIQVTESIGLESAVRRLRGDHQLLTELAECYLEDYPALLAELSKALSAADFATAARAAHNLKGLASNFDAVNTPRLAANCQQLAHDQNTAELANLLPLLERSTHQLASQLETLVKR